MGFERQWWLSLPSRPLLGSLHPALAWVSLSTTLPQTHSRLWKDDNQQGEGWAAFIASPNPSHTQERRGGSQENPAGSWQSALAEVEGRGPGGGSQL